MGSNQATAAASTFGTIGPSLGMFGWIERLLLGATLAAEQTVRLAVDGMWWAGCSYTVKKTLASVAGMAAVDVSMAEKAAVVSFDDAETEVARLTEASAGVEARSRVAE